IQGHTDSVGSEQYNLSLGQARANEVLRYLATSAGLPLHRMNAISYGEYKPIADNKTAAGRGQNRRVSLVVLE
ncbi:MAG: oprF, partial [Acidobacteria bacterium]|nr:oprF [Acidobacteriota bacterium]